ncbi:hypothetical protein L873DRAFT_1823021 [Choiromyces venosus 120613-1]|uniref:Uncharacterized protein n=1 Tax=Choiromyces venosus 120613-1 TaxID=1336337 RepID=A0A3N4IYQ3_9PEZI|nr:hypothetical protein L873DRAFT_1823021 [Choiromyces venosus 120613-1]
MRTLPMVARTEHGRWWTVLGVWVKPRTSSKDGKKVLRRFVWLCFLIVGSFSWAMEDWFRREKCGRQIISELGT